MSSEYQIWHNATKVSPPKMSLSLDKPRDLNHEQYFQQECRLFQQAVRKEVRLLYAPEGSRANSYHTVCDLIVELEIIRQLAARMNKMSPRCISVLIRPKGYFNGEFQEFCQTQILPPLRRLLVSLQPSSDMSFDIRDNVAIQLDAIYDDMTMALNSRE
ncbi:hypothetical protein N7457_000877 [Penicillium paradoxum]|uniref:uncharacterized protein n=1 Tax=Penicillium paradoxum TaxID=176176 RepID=UPI002547C467|nr:uncharacterized protein N7457_000877 [Penicillium paradoxum]KAJ5794278.1 hypothetical protein N7457_000877 [Penicillium paradoxum]